MSIFTVHSPAHTPSFGSPTVLFTDDQYKYVSAEAKVLYGLLLARMDLSAKNGWLDDQGRVYIICTLSEIMEKLNCADNKATKLMNELEDKCGLIERKRQGLGKPRILICTIYIAPRRKILGAVFMPIFRKGGNAQMKLVIAEKPSVAQSLAKVIGANKRQDGYLEGNGYLVSWCIGHLVELSAPERYDERYAKWRLEDLPILPEHFLYEVSPETKKQYQILKSLMERKDVESLVCATDAGREGELIFRLVYSQCRCKKPFERLWISSMEDAAIREGFEKLRPGTEYDALYEAALCRERADWIVGMNATRLFSCLYHQTLAVGRVMTPTLAMVVMRDTQISAFKPEPFWTVQLKAGNINASSRRFSTKSDADSLMNVCQDTKGVVVESVETKEKLEKPPLLYDLTSLQRDANRILGFTAQQTLDYTQSLYEKKLVTYPRTDSRYLTDDMREMLPVLLKAVAEKFRITGSLRNEPVHPASVFDSSKVSDHHAIIPTRTMAESDLTSLPPTEMAILQLISARLLCTAGEDHIESFYEADQKVSQEHQRQEKQH